MESLVAAAAARLVTKLIDVQSARGHASIVLTGGTTGIETLRQVRKVPARSGIDWSAVDIYWGDERFVPADDEQRNEKQAREALLDHLPLNPDRVHPIAPSDGAFGNNPEKAADAYAKVLSAVAKTGDPAMAPAFDVCLFGIGEEGHIASIFPESPAVYEDERSVVAVHGCPKPPPTRITMTLPAIRHSIEVWVLTAGAEKAGAVAMALRGAGEVQVPAAGATGSRRTLWMLDRAAANKVPSALVSPRT
jgi:6-phosphogluconolactonase